MGKPAQFRVRVYDTATAFDAVLRRHSAVVRSYAQFERRRGARAFYALAFPAYMRDGVRAYREDLEALAALGADDPPPPRTGDLQRLLAALHVAFFLQDDVSVAAYKRAIDDMLRAAWARDGPPAWGVYAFARSPTS